MNLEPELQALEAAIDRQHELVNKQLARILRLEAALFKIAQHRCARYFSGPEKCGLCSSCVAGEALRT